MKNTKQNRIAYLRKQFTMLSKTGDIESAVQKLNSVLSHKRQVVIIRKWSELRSEISSELRSELRSELGLELSSELRSEISSEISSELGSEVLKYYDNNWILFISEFYPQLKILQKNKDKIEAIRSLVEAGNCYIWISKTKLYILPFPEIHLEEGRKRLHNTQDYALKFADKITYWLYGVKFDKSLWKKVVRNKLSAKEILKLENMEQRMVALKIKGADRFLFELEAKLIDTHHMGYELYQLDNVFNQTAYYLKYKDPSTDRVYVSGIDPEIGKKGKAILCAGWKFSMDNEIEEYEKLTAHS